MPDEPRPANKVPDADALVASLPGSGEHDLSARRAIKLSLPLRQHLQLHALRVHGGEGLSQMVEAAIDLYLDEVRRGKPAEASPPLLS